MIAVLRARPAPVFAMVSSLVAALVSSFKTICQLGPVVFVVPHTISEILSSEPPLATIPSPMAHVEH